MCNWHHWQRENFPKELLQFKPASLPMYLESSSGLFILVSIGYRSCAWNHLQSIFKVHNWRVYFKWLCTIGIFFLLRCCSGCSVPEFRLKSTPTTPALYHDYILDPCTIQYCRSRGWLWRKIRWNTKNYHECLIPLFCKLSSIGKRGNIWGGQAEEMMGSIRIHPQPSSSSPFHKFSLWSFIDFYLAWSSPWNRKKWSEFASLRKFLFPAKRTPLIRSDPTVPVP